MPPKALKVDSLDLDLENPRITVASDQRDAMQKILKEQKVKVINLAESIAIRGLSPMDRFLVLRSSKQNRFIVIEGNRRLLALKLLKNTSLADSLEMPDAYRKRLHKASKSFNVKAVEPVECFEVEDRAFGNDWIRQRHNGADSGRGIVDWSNIASSRFRGREPALQALDLVLEHADLTEEQGEQINGRFPLTTLDRLLSTPSVRAAIGLHIENGKLLTDLPAIEALKPLRRIVLDLAEGEINVTKLKSKIQQNEYISAFKIADRPNLALRSGEFSAVEGMRDTDFEKAPSAPPKRPRSPKVQPRTSVVAKGCKLNITVPKIASIFEELRSLHLTKHVHAIAVLLRVFLEMSVEDYLAKPGKPGVKYKHPKTGDWHDKKLRNKVEDAIADMVNSGCDQKDFLGVTRGLTDPNHPFSIDTLHAYIHNRFFSPVDTHLTAAWDNAQPFFERIWP